MHLVKIYRPKLAHNIYILALSIFSIPAWAESVQVEAIFFKHLSIPKTELRYQVTPSDTPIELRFFSPQEQDRDVFGLEYIKIHALEHVRLHPHFESLFQSREYQVLFYQAWHQPLIAPSHALSVPLTTSKTPDIQATLKISYTKGIEAEWMVTLQNPESTEQSAIFTEKRLIRLDDLQYFDHPVVGLLLKVRSIPKETHGPLTPTPVTPMTSSSPPHTNPDFPKEKPASSEEQPASSEEQDSTPLLEIPVEPDSKAHD